MDNTYLSTHQNHLLYTSKPINSKYNKLKTKIIEKEPKKKKKCKKKKKKKKKKIDHPLKS